jgi:transposase
MGAPYSLDLRERVVGAIAGGLSCRAAARHDRVSVSSAIRWMNLARQNGTPAALPMGGKKPFSLTEHAEWVRARLAEKPDITGRELLAELHERKIDVSYYGVWHFLGHLGLSFKKTRSAKLAGKPFPPMPPNRWRGHAGSGSAGYAPGAADRDAA